MGVLSLVSWGGCQNAVAIFLHYIIAVAAGVWDGPCRGLGRVGGRALWPSRWFGSYGSKRVCCVTVVQALGQGLSNYQQCSLLTANLLPAKHGGVAREA